LDEGKITKGVEKSKSWDSVVRMFYHWSVNISAEVATLPIQIHACKPPE